jgi:hypothetical protein
VVPHQPGRGRTRIQHRVGPADPRSPGCGRPGTDGERDPDSPRDASHALPGLGGPAVPGHSGTEIAAPGPGRPERRRRSRTASPPADHGRRMDRLRPGTRPSAAIDALPAGSRRPRAGAGHAPHHLRRLDDRRLHPRDDHSLHGLSRGPPTRPGPPADPVCRFHRMATSAAQRPSRGRAAAILGVAGGRHAARARPAHRSPATRRADVPRPLVELPARPRALERPGATGQPGPGYAVHDPPGRVRAAPRTAQRTGRPGHRRTRRQSHARRVRAPDRIPREYPGHAPQTAGPEQFPRLSGASPAHRTRRLPTPGSSLRTIG